MSKVYCLFARYSDGYTYSSDNLLGVYDNEELAYETLIDYETKTKRYEELSVKDELTEKEKVEYKQLLEYDYKNDFDFFVEDYELNKVKGN